MMTVVHNVDYNSPHTLGGDFGGEVPAPNSISLDVSEYKDLKALLARDPSLVNSIYMAARGFGYAGLVNNEKPSQLVNDIKYTQMQLVQDHQVAQLDREEQRRQAEESKLLQEKQFMLDNNKSEEQKLADEENKKSGFSAMLEDTLDTFVKGGKDLGEHFFQAVDEQIDSVAHPEKANDNVEQKSSLGWGIYHVMDVAEASLTGIGSIVPMIGFGEHQSQGFSLAQAA